MSSSMGRPPPSRPNRPSTSIAGLLAVAVVAVLASALTTLTIDSLRAREAAPERSSAEPTAAAAATPASASLQDAVGAVLPAVVSLSTGSGSGSGVVVSRDGWLLTNRHVVDCETAVDVTFADGRTGRATVEAIDSLTDLALLRTPARPLTPAVLGKAASLEVGQPVAAIGNSEGFLASTVTSGVVSALWRQVYLDDEGEYRNLIQSDAAIYGGNSGGPLINLDGEVVGINTATALTGDQVRAQGLSFAIPSELAQPIVAQAIAGSELSRPWLGVRHLPVDPGLVEREGLSVDRGALVWPRRADDGTTRAAVSKGSPAAEAGVLQGDVILAVDGLPVDAQNPLDNVLVGFDAGAVVTLTVARGEQQLELTVELGQRAGRPVGC